MHPISTGHTRAIMYRLLDLAVAETTKMQRDSHDILPREATTRRQSQPNLPRPSHTLCRPDIPEEDA